jgi:hypothetical protein
MKCSKALNGRTHAAVLLVTARNCCVAVKALEGSRILAAKAPSLPMPDCSMPSQCRCRFQKYTDRRNNDENRRFLYASERSAWYSGDQRRQSSGRRTAD